MAGIKLYRSNSIEELSDALAENIKSPLSSPLAPETILVQSLGMAKWLNLGLAKRLGVWANGNLLFPNSLINSLFSRVIQGVDAKLFLEKEIMTWLIFDRLRLIRLNLLDEQHAPPPVIKRADEGSFELHENCDCYDYIQESSKLSHLAEYCKGEDRNFREFQLARQLAMTFDQYLTYRPELVESWESNRTSGKSGWKNDNWQATLWRSICKGHFTHKAAIRSEFIASIEEIQQHRNRESGRGILRERLPERISVFGIPSLPLFHLDILASLSSFMDISFYVMSPAKGYFSDLRSAKEKMKREILGGERGISSELLHIETGNPLLSSLGRAGADFMESLLNYDNLEDIDINFVEPSGKTILSMVQQDILLMRDRGNPLYGAVEKDDSLSPLQGLPQEEEIGDIREDRRTLLSPDEVRRDNSIVISSCHSPMREVEVLNDYLLELFDSNPDITPADVLVMTPDIESYAPFVRAVFTTPEEERLKIPFSIADIGIQNVSRVVDVFINILSLPESRFEATFIMDILECDDVARRFGIEASDMDIVREWIKETAIRWGRDGKYRENIGLPRFEENSWRAGLDRLMAGYAMTGRCEQFFTSCFADRGVDEDIDTVNILPCDSVEGNSSRVLGSLSRFFNTLSDTASIMAESMSLSGWGGFLMDVTDKFFLSDGDNSSMVQEIRNSLNELKRMEEITGFKSPVSSRIIKSWFNQSIGKEYRDSNFLNGGVTFCAMLPMRSIPAKVICILGLNDGIFPRMDSSPNFDLIRQNPRRGDRSLRNEDRYLFLETLISARERLYLSYTGQGIEDNSVIPPSVVISELMDYLDQGFVVKQISVHQYNDEFTRDNTKDNFSSNKVDLNVKLLSSYIVTKHRLQPFSPAYFEQTCSSGQPCSAESVCSNESSGLFSYSKGNFLAASALRRAKANLKPFISDEIVSRTDIISSKPTVNKNHPDLTRGDEGIQIILLSNLVSFFSAPQRYFLENTLGIYLKDQGETIDDCEPFSLDNLENYNLKDDMLNRMIKGREIKNSGAENGEERRSGKTRGGEINIDIYRAKGVLPHGTAGLALYQENKSMVRSFYSKISEYIESGRSEPLEVDITGSGWRLKGVVSDMWRGRIVRFRVASVKPKDILRAWIIHLAYTCHLQNKMKKTDSVETGNMQDNLITIDMEKTLVIGSDKICHFLTPDNPLSILESLIELYQKGIKTPLRFFPVSSMAYAEEIFGKEKGQQHSVDKAISKAENEFKGTYGKSGERQSDDIELCFRNIDTPLDDEFCSVSAAVWIPVLEHLGETEQP